ncbi:MAG: UvrD-helicase domain-containing protein [Candidatus Cloacimonetes bacterium]|nr:UvrD-helicase domain-containing protein [Candidatus Cloacimonadota bacterium]
MNAFSSKIITASAGTGKTYRLALEYIRIILDFYTTSQDFSLDNILVLTFTKKATAEIRERINAHLALLCNEHPATPKAADDRRGLLASLWPEQTDPKLSDKDKEVLNLALRALSTDRRQLQVMTIDAYVNSVFRNIVRPLRSIESFEIDIKAVEKRLPFLLQHLMKPEYQGKLDSLLSRRISPSLDEYQNFFSSLIEQRWLQFQIQKKEGRMPDEGTLWKLHKEGDPAARDQALAGVRESLELLLSLLEQYRPQHPPAKSTVQGFRRLFPLFPDSYAALREEVAKLCSTPGGCLRLFQNCPEGKIVDGGKFRGKALADANQLVLTLQSQLYSSLADYLLHTHFLPEQAEILELWSALLEEYDKLIYLYKNMSYDDISWFTLEALFSTDPPQFDMQVEAVATEFYQFLAHRSRFILIDEFQDTSLIQFAILKPIIEEVISGQGTKDFGGLIVVGDEKQSIFSWRGGERELLLNLRSIFGPLSDLKLEPLERSFRSSRQMVAFVNRVFGSSLIAGRLREFGLKWPYKPLTEAMDELDPQTRVEFQAAAYSKSAGGRSLSQVYQHFVSAFITPNYSKDSPESMAVICRTGKELAAIQKVLDSEGIGSIYQPSSTLPEHAWVSPLLAWLRWLAWRHWLDFLEVLRSDYVLLKASELKKVADEIAAARGEARDPDFSACPLAAALHKLSQNQAGSVSRACQQLVDLCLPVQKCAATEAKNPQAFERDYLNVHAFLSLARDFELSSARKDKSIPAFLDYLEDNDGQDFLKQVSVEGEGSLQLLTVHKSKGLQFDRVFLLYNLSSRGGNDSSYLKAYTDFAGADFQDLRDFGLTYHYAEVIKASRYKTLAETAEYREMLEEMNNLYVAFTRAKTSLHLCFAFEGKDGWDKYVADRQSGKLKLPVLVAAAAENFCQEEKVVPGEDGIYIWPESSPQAAKREAKDSKPEGVTVEALAKALPPIIADRFAGIPPNEIDERKDWKKIWLEDRHNLFGDLAHHYLRFVKRDLPAEHEYAARQCLARFGSLLTPETIQARIQILRSNLPRERIFTSGYDRVFTEFTLWHRGRELRLDRLLLDTAGKRALILDYKTGDSRDEQQLQRYANALLALPALREQNYQVQTDFIDLKI